MTDLSNNSLVGSWERSKKHGVSLQTAREAILGAQELKVYQEENEAFIQKLYPTIEQLSVSLKNSNSVVSLSNRDGILLHTLGDPTFIKETEKIHVQAGACWSEEVRGTNSAGTVSIEKRPIAVVGKDHYLGSHHMLYCVGSPIFGPSGKLQAVLNISGHAELYHPSLLGLVDMIARKIENWLLIQRLEKQMIISLQQEGETTFEALLAVDKNGEIIGTNRAARDLLPVFSETSLIHLSELFAEADYLLEGQKESTFHLEMMRGDEKGNRRVHATVLINSYPKSISFARGRKGRIVHAGKTKEQLYTFDEIYGEDPEFLKALATAKKVATTDYTVVITGESGTGKDLISQAIHQASLRADASYVALNCGAITKSLAESELFGYEAGAFTGAKQAGHAGVFERANGGTLFLDEIAELSLDVQASLLRVLQDFKVMRIGGTEPIDIDVRIITATHANLWEKVQAGEFRADLFFRLQGVNIHLPALRERVDRLQYAELFLREIMTELGADGLAFSETAQQLIRQYDWPGNIRQLSSALREAAFSAETGIIESEDFPLYIISGLSASVPPSSGSLLQDTENHVILSTLRETKGNISEAARILGIGRNTLYRKLEKLEVPFELD